MIRLFVGADGANCDLESQMVLEYSLRKYASEPIDITWMQQSATGPYSGWQCGSGRTPFTHFRWSVPAMRGYQGKAIYCDVDFIFRDDIVKLYNQTVPGVFLAKIGKSGIVSKTCCMLFDCEHAIRHIPDLETLQHISDPQGDMMRSFRVKADLCGAFIGDWNCIDLKGYADINDTRIKAIHYSRIEMQPSFPYAQARLAKEGKKHWYTGPTGPHERPELTALFEQMYREALAAGYTLEQYRVQPFESKRRNFTYSHSKVVA